jgi:hypothetical protein
MKVYLAGPMSVYVDHNFPAFNNAAKVLRERGFEVINPAELVEDPTKPWEYYMRRDIPLLCTCDAIALLPGWSDSRGAQLEAKIAQELGMAEIMVRDYVAAIDHRQIIGTKELPNAKT